MIDRESQPVRFGLFNVVDCTVCSRSVPASAATPYRPPMEHLSPESWRTPKGLYWLLCQDCREEYLTIVFGEVDRQATTAAEHSLWDSDSAVRAGAFEELRRLEKLKNREGGSATT